MERRTITIIGSSEFHKEIIEKSWEFIKQGFMVLHPFFEKKIDSLFDGKICFLSGKEKIDLSGMVFVFNKNNRIDEFTRTMLDYAKETGKVIQYLEKIEENISLDK
jgi:hypothetical protein